MDVPTNADVTRNPVAPSKPPEIKLDNPSEAQGRKDIESVLFNPQIDSHQSQFANYRLHLIELGIDNRRIHMRENPTIENIIGYWAYLETNYSYIRSMVQCEIKDDTFDTFEKRILKLDAIKSEMLQYWNFFKFGIVDTINTPLVLLFQRQNPKGYQRSIQARMVTLANTFSDLLRTCYQSLSYYFRQNKVKRNLGIEGDLIRVKLMQIRKSRKDLGNINIQKGKWIKDLKAKGVLKDDFGTVESQN